MRRETKLLLELCGPDGLTRPELLAAARQRAAYLWPADVEQEVQRALTDGALVEVGGRLCAPVAPEPERTASRPRRLIVFDLESIVRPTVKEPYREQHVFQIGAVRFGPDAGWVAEQETFEAFTALRTAVDEGIFWVPNARGSCRPCLAAPTPFRSPRCLFRGGGACPTSV